MVFDPAARSAGTAAGGAIMGVVPDQRSDVLLERFWALPAAAPLLARSDRLDGVHLVGGAVRDLMLGGNPVDLDLVVEGDVAALVTSLGVPARAHERFGTWQVSLAGSRYDLAQARQESYPRPGALPIVEPATLAEDLGRRDFTVNAMALTLAGADRGRLVAHPQAQDDLRGRRLRILHDRSFVEDPTRLLRLARYRGRLGFEIEPHTRRLVADSVAAGVLETVSGARIGAELRLLAAERDPVCGLLALRELELDGSLAPGFGLGDPELARRAVGLLGQERDRAAMALAAAAIGVSAPDLARWLNELAFPASERDTILAAAGGARGLAGALARAASPSAIVAAVGGAPPELVALAGALGPESAAREWMSGLRRVQLEIDGRDLLNAGLPAGPAVGEGLRAALAAKLDGRADGREAQLAEALRAAGSRG